jgi:hypothetical protein
MLPHFLLRSTGFAFELLDTIACPHSATRSDALLDANAALTARVRLVQEALAAESDPATRKMRRKCFNRVERLGTSGLDDDRLDRLAPATAAVLQKWDTAVANRDQRLDELRKFFTAELQDRREALRKLVSDPRFGEAVWLSSPQMHQIGLRGYVAASEARSDTRRAERQLVAYLERFCAKNDTSSFFGPIDYGHTSTESGPEPVGGRVTDRAAFLAHWAVTALAVALAADPDIRLWLRPALSAACTVLPDERPGKVGVRVVVAGRALTEDKTSSFGGSAAAVLRLLDGARTTADIAAELGDESVAAVLDRLAVAGLVRLTPDVPVTVPHPSRWLRDWLAALPDECAAKKLWLDRITPLLDIESAFAHASFDDKRELLAVAERHFQQVTGVDPRRGGGELYADRTLYYEEAVGAASPFTLDPSVTDLILQRLAPVLDVYAAHALAAQRDVRRAGAARLAAMLAEGGGERALALATVVSALREVPLPAAPNHWAAAVQEQVRGRENERVVDLDPALVPQPAAGDLASEALLTSCDLMLVADSVDDVRAGRFDIVVGECHDQLLVWGWPLYFHDDPAAVQRAGEEALRDVCGGLVYGNVVPTRRVKISPFQYPGPAITLGGVRPGGDDEVPIASVTARISDGRPVLSAPGVDAFGLYNAEQQTFAHRIFAAPRLVPPPAVETGTHTPRLQIGGVVVQRERWRLRKADLFGAAAHTGDGVDLLLAYRSCVRRFTLPRYVFARVPGDRKPMFVDAASWFSLQALYHLIPDDRDVVLTEMVPGPEGLWLRGEGGRHCAELRMTAFYHRDHADDRDAVGNPT